MDNDNISIKIKLENVKVIEMRSGSNDNIYYIIFDNNKQTDNAYFCFDRSLDRDWGLLTNGNYRSIKQVELEYLKEDKGNRVISLVVIDQQF